MLSTLSVPVAGDKLSQTKAVLCTIIIHYIVHSHFEVYNIIIIIVIYCNGVRRVTVAQFFET